MGTDLAAALLIGFAASGHCIFMCGGIAAAFRAAPELSPARRKWLALLFQLGRLLSYAVIGTLFGSLVVYLGDILALGAWLRMLAGLLLVAMGLYLADIWRGLARLEKPFVPLWQKLSRRAVSWLPATRARQALAIGAIWGWLPCGLVYSTLAWAATAARTPWEAGLLMLAMGVGTLPAMLGVHLVGNLLRRALSRRLAGLMLCLFGLWTLWLPAQALWATGSGAPVQQHSPTMGH